MAFALLVLCPLSLAFGCRSIGDKIMRNAKTMIARRWIVRYFFYGYSALMLLPAYFFGTAIFLGFIPSKLRPAIFVLATLFAICFFISYLVFVHLRYQFVQNAEESQNDSDYTKLEKLVSRGSIALSVVLTVLLPVMLYSMVYKDMMAFFQTGRIQQGLLMVLFPLLLFGTLGSIHRGMILYFRYYLFLSRDQESAQKADEVIGPFFKKIQDELQNIVLFLILPIGANVAHLMFRWTHPLSALLELTCFVPWWGIVIWLNIKQPKYRWYYIIGTEVLQILIMVYIRSFA